MNRSLSALFLAVLGAASSMALQAQTKDPKIISPALTRATAVTTPLVAAAGEEADVKRILKERFPGLEVVSITKSPYFGLYEVFAGDQLVYTDAKVSYVMVGTVIDPMTRVNLTEERLQALKAINVADLPIDQAIKIVRGKGERKVIVFSDADCPYCKQFERTVAEMDNITVYVLLYPIDQLHPDAARKSKMIWCSADRPKAWLDFMLKGVMPTNDGSCETPLPQLQAVAQKYRVVATPTLVFMDGRVVPGALPRDRLEKELARSDAAVKTAKK